MVQNSWTSNLANRGITRKYHLPVKLPALPRGASVAKPSETAPKQLDLISTEAQPAFALMDTARSPVAIPPRASARGILAKASEIVKHALHERFMWPPFTPGPC